MFTLTRQCHCPLSPGRDFCAGRLWLACAEAIDAVGFAIALQEALLEVDWPADILPSPHASLVTAACGKPIFKGLRVRLAIHTGIPTSTQVCRPFGKVVMGTRLCQLIEEAKVITSTCRQQPGMPAYLIVKQEGVAWL